MLPAKRPAPDLSNARRDVRAIPRVVSWRCGTLTSLCGAAGVVCLSERLTPEVYKQIPCAASGSAGAQSLRQCAAGGPVCRASATDAAWKTAPSPIPLAMRRLRLARKGAKSVRGPAMLGGSFVGGGDLEQQRLIERPSEKFHGDWNLIGFRSIQPAAVRIACIRHTIINNAGE